MRTKPKRRGPRLHRFFIFLLSCVLTVLLVWLLSFLLSDIGRIPGPDRGEIEKAHIGEELAEQLEATSEEQRRVTTRIRSQVDIQRILDTSTKSSRDTMSQLLDLQRLKIERGLTPSDEEQAALVDSETLFLENQRKFQEANAEIARLAEQDRGLEETMDALNEQANERRREAREEYQSLSKSHQLRIATIKLVFLIPLLLAAAWLVLKKRATGYAPIIYAAFIATFWTIGRVVRQHFPSELFKYIFIAAGIGVVLAFLVYLIRMVVRPKIDWLLKQYREAYNKHLCPVCAHPIMRGPLKHVTWSAKGPKKNLAPASAPESGEEDLPYICPSCGEQLFEKCEKCAAVRHSLLPYCEACGEEKPFGAAEESVADAPAA